MNGQVIAALVIEAILVVATTVCIAQPSWLFGEEKRTSVPLTKIGYLLLGATLLWSVIFGGAMALDYI